MSTARSLRTTSASTKARATSPRIAFARAAASAVAVAALQVAPVAGVAITGVFASGCSRSYIPNTDVPDTSENRGLVAFCEKYRKAVIRRDIPALIEMISPDYYEDGGNVDASDDLDYAGVKDYLEDRFQDAKSIRYEIRYRRITKEHDRIYVDYTFTASWRIPVGAGEEWQRKVDDNRLELVKSGDNYLIVAGL